MSGTFCSHAHPPQLGAAGWMRGKRSAEAITGPALPGLASLATWPICIARCHAKRGVWTRLPGRRRRRGVGRVCGEAKLFWSALWRLRCRLACFKARMCCRRRCCCCSAAAMRLQPNTSAACPTPHATLRHACTRLPLRLTMTCLCLFKPSTRKLPHAPARRHPDQPCCKLSVALRYQLPDLADVCDAPPAQRLRRLPRTSWSHPTPQLHPSALARDHHVPVCAPTIHTRAAHCTRNAGIQTSLPANFLSVRASSRPA